MWEAMFWMECFESSIDSSCGLAWRASISFYGIMESGSVVKNLPANAWASGAMGLIPGLGRSPGGGNGSPFQYSCLGNPMDRGAWRATVHGIAESDATEHAYTGRGGRVPWERPLCPIYRRHPLAIYLSVWGYVLGHFSQVWLFADFHLIILWLLFSH